jgi:hypothetical protein
MCKLRNRFVTPLEARQMVVSLDKSNAESIQRCFTAVRSNSGGVVAITRRRTSGVVNERLSLSFLLFQALHSYSAATMGLAHGNLKLDHGRKSTRQ